MRNLFAKLVDVRLHEVNVWADMSMEGVTMIAPVNGRLKCL